MTNHGNSITSIAFALVVASAPVSALAASDAERSSDLWLEAKLSTTYLLNEHLNPFELDVDVEKGTAKIAGTVDSEAEKSLAVELARGIEGIHDVRDEIVVGDPSKKQAPAAESSDERSFSELVSDATTTATVKSRLLWNSGTSGSEIDVDTAGGVVTLKGQVASDVEKDLAVEIAENTEGVRRVEDRLEVGGSAEKADAATTEKAKSAAEKAEQAVSDAWITTKVKSSLLYDERVSGFNVDVDTRKGVVTLSGGVESDEEKARAEDLAKSTVGVLSVKNQLEVGSAAR